MNWFHRHRYTITGAHQMERVHRKKDLGEVHTPITEVLMVCSCGAVKTLELDGSWTLSQLQPAQQTEGDREFFRKIGLKL